MYECESHSTHPLTDQHEWVGCRRCAVEMYAASTSFFGRHIYEEGDPKRPGRTYFRENPSESTLTIASTGNKIVLDDKEKLFNYLLNPSRGTLMWNTRHGSANWLVEDVGWGSAGSGTTSVGKFTKSVPGVVIAKSLHDDAHAIPVDPDDRWASNLTTWLWRCVDCGAMAPAEDETCLGCQQEGRPPRG